MIQRNGVERSEWRGQIELVLLSLHRVMSFYILTKCWIFHDTEDSDGRDSKIMNLEWSDEWWLLPSSLTSTCHSIHELTWLSRCFSFAVMTVLFISHSLRSFSCLLHSLQSLSPYQSALTWWWHKTWKPKSWEWRKLRRDERREGKVYDMNERLTGKGNRFPWHQLLSFGLFSYFGVIVDESPSHFFFILLFLLFGKSFIHSSPHLLHSRWNGLEGMTDKSLFLTIFPLLLQAFNSWLGSGIMEKRRRKVHHLYAISVKTDMSDKRDIYFLHLQVPFSFL